jgi:hypothetical protein
MQPEEWLAAIAAAIETQDWDRLRTLKLEANQPLVLEGESGDLVEFYDAALKEAATPEVYERVRVKDLASFEARIREVILQGLEKANSRGDVQALYLEYFYDGGDASDANLFLCVQYSPDNDEWGAEFDGENVIEGPSVLEYLNYDPDFKLEPPLDTICLEYVDGILLASCAKLWLSLEKQDYPFAFARHDEPMIRIGTA